MIDVLDRIQQCSVELDSSSWSWRSRRPSRFSPGTGFNSFFWSRSASVGVHCTRASGVPIDSSCGRVRLTCTCGVLLVRARGGVHCTRAGGVFAVLQDLVVFKMFRQHRVRRRSAEMEDLVLGPQNLVRGQSSTAVRRDGGPGGGLQKLCPRTEVTSAWGSR